LNLKEGRIIPADLIDNLANILLNNKKAICEVNPISNYDLKFTFEGCFFIVYGIKAEYPDYTRIMQKKGDYQYSLIDINIKDNINEEWVLDCEKELIKTKNKVYNIDIINNCNVKVIFQSKTFNLLNKVSCGLLAMSYLDGHAPVFFDMEDSVIILMPIRANYSEYSFCNEVGESYTDELPPPCVAIEGEADSITNNDDAVASEQLVGNEEVVEASEDEQEDEAGDEFLDELKD
jgi:hypothetical protein